MVLLARQASNSVPAVLVPEMESKEIHTGPGLRTAGAQVHGHRCGHCATAVRPRAAEDQYTAAVGRAWLTGLIGPVQSAPRSAEREVTKNDN